MRILVIGGMGLIGGAIIEAAAGKQIDATIVSRRKLGEKWKKLGVKGISGDWQDDSFAHSVVEADYDVIVDTVEFTEKQLVRSLEICDKHCKQFVFISTDSVYEKPAKNVREDDEIELHNIKWKYGYDKRKAELVLMSDKDRYSFEWTIVRPPLTFDETRIPVGFASKRDTYTLCQRILDGKPIIRFDDPGSRHTICHVSTFGASVVNLFMNEAAYGQSYHIADDQTYTYDEIFDVIGNVLGVKAQFVFLPTEVVRKYNEGLYEEMIYDKNPFFTVDNTKIKCASKDAVYHVSLEDVIQSEIEHLKMTDGVDSEYELISDTLLLKSVTLVTDEAQRKLVENYVTSMTREYVASLKEFDRNAFAHNVIKPIRCQLGKVKRLVLNRIGILMGLTLI